jgi:poly(A) polymerase
MTQLDAKHSQWLTRPETQELLRILNAGEAITRCVGGCVRDTLLQVATRDTEVDMATNLAPEEVMQRLKAAAIKGVGTGLQHGTVSAILHIEDATLIYEITSLRVDVATDGRHAKVAFTQDWQGDAARRDFTINALYTDADGTLHDPTGQGLDDIKAKHVRFIGAASARIEEDYLRVLRYFRFHFRLTPEADLDAEALAACAAAAPSMATLSGERRQAEMLKIIRLAAAPKAARALNEAGLLAAILELPPQGLDALDAMVALSDDPILRLMALLPDAASGVGLAKSLRLSNKQGERIRAALSKAPEGRDLQEAFYVDGPVAVVDRAYLACAKGHGDAAHLQAAVRQAEAYQRPKFPLTGAMMQAAGLPNGPTMGVMSRLLEAWWVEHGFPDEAAVAAELAVRMEK